MLIVIDKDTSRIFIIDSLTGSILTNWLNNLYEILRYHNGRIEKLYNVDSVVVTFREIR